MCVIGRLFSVVTCQQSDPKPTRMPMGRYLFPSSPDDKVHPVWPEWKSVLLRLNAVRLLANIDGVLVRFEIRV